jgi:hypothetical protein
LFSASLWDHVQVDLEWCNSLLPGWMVLWESVDREDFGKLGDVHDLELLQLKVSVENTVVELAHECHRVSAGEVTLLAVVDRQFQVDFWLSFCSHGVGDLLEVLVVRSTL